MAYKRILTIQDISCVGQCSMTVALPILSACGHEVCILPAALLSTHTGGFGKPAVVHFTELIPQIIDHWKANKIDFDLIYVGYLGSVQAVEYARLIMDSMLAPGGMTVVDPAMADHGKLYSGLDQAYADAMMALCTRADVMIPNITEAVMMAGGSISDSFDREEITRLMKTLPGRDVVMTGVGFENDQTGYGIRSGENVSFGHHHKVDRNFHGTGDIFASAFVGALACGKKLDEAAKIAAAYTYRCICITCEEPAHWYGVRFESALPDLINMLK